MTTRALNAVGTSVSFGTEPIPLGDIVYPAFVCDRNNRAWKFWRPSFRGRDLSDAIRSCHRGTVNRLWDTCAARLCRGFRCLSFELKKLFLEDAENCVSPRKVKVVHKFWVRLELFLFLPFLFSLFRLGIWENKPRGALGGCTVVFSSFQTPIIAKLFRKFDNNLSYRI